MKTVNLTTIIALSTILALSGCGSSGDSTPTITQPIIEEPTIPTVEYIPFDAPILDEGTKHEYLTAINNVRATGRYCGATFYPAVPPLVWNDSLYKASYEHSEDLVVSGTFSHDGSGTDSDWTAQVLELEFSTSQDRGNNNGYIGGVGENVTFWDVEDYTLNEAIKNFLESEGHCVNMMRSKYTNFGMAHYDNIWTQNFGIGG
jgi:uncharacterized protein YkwD